MLFFPVDAYVVPWPTLTKNLKRFLIHLCTLTENPVQFCIAKESRAVGKRCFTWTSLMTTHPKQQDWISAYHIYLYQDGHVAAVHIATLQNFFRWQFTKVEKILIGSLDSIPSPSPWVGKFAWGVKTKHCWVLSTNFWKQKVCWHHPAMFCLITSSKISCQ